MSMVGDAWRSLEQERAAGCFLLRKKVVTWTPYRKRCRTEFFTVDHGTKLEMERELNAFGVTFGSKVERAHGRAVLENDNFQRNVTTFYYVTPSRKKV